MRLPLSLPLFVLAGDDVSVEAVEDEEGVPAVCLLTEKLLALNKRGTLIAHVDPAALAEDKEEQFTEEGGAGTHEVKARSDG